MKKLLLIATIALCGLTASAQLPNVTLQDINGKKVQTGSISNNGKPIIIESEGLDPTGLEEVKRCIDFLKANEASI
jgi:hypothetical protein